MRLYLALSKNNTIIPFNYQHLLTGCFHKWLGKNNKQHGGVSMYSFSWLMNTTTDKNGIWLRDDSYMFISVYESVMLKKIIRGIQESPNLFNDVMIKDIMIKETPSFASQEQFVAASPIFVKRKEKHYTYKNKEANDLMTETLQTKLKKAGLHHENCTVEFDSSYALPKTKLIRYNEIKNRCSVCPVIVKGTPEQVAFAWEVGIGSSTGIGFGALK
ncbi:MAG: CRISPR-associated endoribonuclease Cas6 [Cellulophaga sp.]